MKVSELRDAIDALTQWVTSYKSAATPEERTNEARAVRRTATELRQALNACKTAKPRDTDRANGWIAQADKILANHPDD